MSTLIPVPEPLYRFTNTNQALKDLINNSNKYYVYINLDKNVGRDLHNDPDFIRLNAMNTAIAMAISDANWRLQLASSSGGNNKKNKARQTKRPRQTKRGKSRRRR